MTIHIFSHFPTIKGKKNENTPCLNQKPWALFLKIMKVTNMVVPTFVNHGGPPLDKITMGALPHDGIMMNPSNQLKES